MADRMAASERGSQVERQYDAATSSLQVSWQTLHALASETGHAVKHTFTDSAVSTSGHVQQGSQVHACPKHQEQQDHSEALLDSSQVGETQWELKQKVASPPNTTTAVQADIRNVERKMLSSDAATEVILRFNFLTEWESRAALLCVAISILLGAAVLITEFVKKMQVGDDAYSFRRKTIYVWNVAVGSSCLLLVTISVLGIVWRVLVAARLHKTWKHRQQRNVTLIMVEACVQWLNLACYVLPNAWLLSNPCYVATGTWYWFGFVRWTCWNTIFMLFLVHAYSTRVWQRQEADNSKVSVAVIEHGFHSPEGHRKLVMDGPWTLLWPCVLLWPLLQGALTFGWVHNAVNQDGFEECQQDYSMSDGTCGVDNATAIAVDIIVALSLLYFVTTYMLLFLKLKGYRKLPYTFIQVGLVYNTLQLWLRLVVMTFFVLCLVLLWLVGPGWCTSQEFSWLGLMPMQIVMTATTAVLCYVASPTTPQKHVAAQTVWLQEFAWTQADKPIKLEARSKMVPDNPNLASQPMFCFETMLNLLYWSCLVYDHKKEQEQVSIRNSVSKVSPEEQSKVCPEEQSKLEGTSFSAKTTLTLETAMSLYGLTESQSFWEIQQDTRSLIAWGNNTVVVSFRGTASMKNALADLQVWRIAHPPLRGQKWLGSRPLVHVGFLKSWLAGGLHLKVVNQVLEAVQQCKEQSKSDQPVTVYITGHSLGGALATLAAYDIRKQLLNNQQGNVRVICYTFAAPRTGNHAFARDYNAMVPDTWSIINDQDVVTREGKMIFLYKRPGQRVIVNAAGHMMVRPTHMEASVQKSTGGQSVRHHLLTNYFHAILTVVLAQFSGLGFLDGMEGIIRLAEASSYIRDLLEKEMGMSLPEMRSFCQADPETRSDQTLPGAHLPTKGFWIIKRPTAPSTAAAPSLAGRLKQTVSLSRALHTAPSLHRTSDGNI